jgi:hypothetical protein
VSTCNELYDRIVDVGSANRYPLAYCFCVLPVSVARWTYFGGNNNVPSAATFFAVFTHDLFGAVNVLLLLTTRPGLLLFNAVADKPPPRPIIETRSDRKSHVSSTDTLRMSVRSSSAYNESLELDTVEGSCRMADNGRMA